MPKSKGLLASFCAAATGRVIRSAGLALLLTLQLDAAQAEGQRNGLVSHGPFYFVRDAPEVIYLSGFLRPDAFHGFLRVLEASGRAERLVLSSDGGNVSAALDIAREIEWRGLDTRVPPGAGCYSACAFLFLAGKSREVQGELGVHQIASATEDFEAGQAAIASLIETLAPFDVPSEVYVRMFETPHSQIYVFSRQELRRLGLHRKASDQMAFVHHAPRLQGDRLHLRAADFLTLNNWLWSQENGRALSGIKRNYAPEVTYLGASVSRAAVIAKKRAFAEVWPERRFRLVEGTASVSCGLGRCHVRGEVEWRARNAERAMEAAGRSLVEMELREVADGFLILEENERILERY